MLALDPSKRITLVEALAHPWFDQALPEVDIVVGGKHVRGVMREFNARRAGLTLRNLRQRGRQVRKRLSETAEDIIKHLPIPGRRGSVTKEEVARDAPTDDQQEEGATSATTGSSRPFQRRRNSASGSILHAMLGGSAKVAAAPPEVATG